SQRDHTVAGRHVHRAVDDDRRDLLVKLEGSRAGDGPAFAIEAIVPYLLEPADRVRRKLIERREAGAGEIAMEVGPIGRALRPFLTLDGRGAGGRDRDRCGDSA